MLTMQLRHVKAVCQKTRLRGWPKSGSSFYLVISISRIPGPPVGACRIGAPHSARRRWRVRHHLGASLGRRSALLAWKHQMELSAAVAKLVANKTSASLQSRLGSARRSRLAKLATNGQPWLTCERCNPLADGRTNASKSAGVVENIAHRR